MTHAPASPLPLAGLLQDGPVVLAFFKGSCPTCQLAFPFLERLHARGAVLRIVGISQNGAADTEAFRRRFGITFTTLLDPAGDGYAISNAYRLTHVPAIFVVETDLAISHAWTGFSKADFEQLALRAQAPVFDLGDSVPAWKPG